MQSATKRRIRVLVADDSAVMRGVLRSVLKGAELAGTAMEMCGVSHDGVECLEAVARLRPDVLLLDLEMPRMHGLDVLDKLRALEPGLPVIMCSAYTERGARTTLDALARGAVDYVMKPTGYGESAASMSALAAQLLPKIAALAGARQRWEKEAAETRPTSSTASPGGLDGRPNTAGAGDAGQQPRIQIVVIGLSTGGPSALEQMLPRLPRDFPVPVMIVQHMPKLFTWALAERLDRCCGLEVKQAHHHAVIRPGTVWLAPGDAHMEVGRAASFPRAGQSSCSAAEFEVRLHQEAPLHSCKPAVDYLFRSAAKMFGEGVLAVVMTGMGADGVDGARAVHRAGGTVLAQDEATSAVWGMPGRVMQAGIAGAALPLGEIARELMDRVSGGGFGRQATRQAGNAPLQTISRWTGIGEMGHGLLG